VAPGSEGSSRNTPSAWVAGVLEAATGAKRTASQGGTAGEGHRPGQGEVGRSKQDLVCQLVANG